MPAWPCESSRPVVQTRAMPPLAWGELLRKKAARAQLAAKLQALGSQGGPTSDREARSMRRLLADLDAYISAAEQTGAPPVPRVSSRDSSPSAGEHDERRARRGRVKAQMRRWDAKFELQHGRRPREVCTYVCMYVCTYVGMYV